MDEESLFPRRLLKLMGGGSENGAFYSMGKQVQEGEFKSMDYIVKADAILNEFKADKANRKWLETADGQRKKKENGTQKKCRRSWNGARGTPLLHPERP